MSRWFQCVAARKENGVKLTQNAERKTEENIIILSMSQIDESKWICAVVAVGLALMR
jgi:hypothetical protein